MKNLIAFLFVLLLTTAANATNICAVYNFMAEFRGTCTKAIFLGKDMTSICAVNAYSKSASYGLMRKGRGVFHFYLDGIGAMWFSGPEKSAPNLENYQLPLTRVELPDHKGKPRGKQRAKGECSIMSEPKGATIIKCSAVITGGNLEFELRSTESPDVTDCKKLDETG